MTTRMIFMISCYVGVLILVACVRKVKQRKEALSRTIETILWIEIVAVLASIVISLINIYIIISLAYGVYYVCMLWLCYFMVQYTCQYTKVKTHMLWIDDLWKVLLVVDSVSLILNAFFGHMIDFKLYGKGVDIYWVTQPEFLYSVHLVICTIMIMEVIIRMTMSLVKSPIIYRWKYLSVLIMFLLIVGADAFFYYNSELLDASILVFAVGSIILTYNSFYFVPDILRKRMLSMVFRNMQDTLVLFDDKGNCVYVNNKRPQNDVVTKMKKEDFDEALKAAHAKQSDICVYYGTECRYYEDRFDELRDKNGKYIGCYYIFRDVTTEHELLHSQYYLANFDSLTGLYNRNRFFRLSEKYMKEMPDEQFLIVCSDIRRLKVINEVFGIQVGDRLLKLVASVLHDYIDEKMIYGRVEPDTFALCIPERYFDVERYVQMTHDAIKTLNINYPVINHIGIYRVEDRSLTISAMCDRAMLAVNSIKSDFQREIVYYDDSLREKLLRDQDILKDIQVAFEQDQFVIYLQPQFNHKTRQIIGAEALVRWVHPEKGVVAPNEFIPLLEANGLITKLNMHVWELACKQLQKWKNDGREDMSVSVNISNKDFFYVDIYEVLTGLIRKYDISVSSLKLEITESAFTIDLVKQLEMIEKLQDEGFIIEMDDFGSGYSSLNSLKDIPVDVLKMDMEFMSKSDRYKRSADILQMVVAMADKLSMPVIAEGVETKEQADFLGKIGCNIIQGYYYAKPMPVSEFEKLLIKSNGV